MTRYDFLVQGARLLRQCIKNPENKTAATKLDNWRKRAQLTEQEAEDVRLMARNRYV